MREFLDIILLIITKSNLEYDIFLLTDLITGFCMNSKYEFPVYRFSENLCIKYQTKYHTGYFDTLFYFEKEEAVNCFFKYAKREQIIIDDCKQYNNSCYPIIFIISEIQKRPGLYITKYDLKHIKAFLEGYFAGEDLKANVEIGTNMTKFDREFEKYLSKKYELFEDREWYYKIEYITIGFKKNLDELVKCLKEFMEIDQ